MVMSRESQPDQNPSESFRFIIVFNLYKPWPKTIMFGNPIVDGIYWNQNM